MEKEKYEVKIKMRIPKKGEYYLIDGNIIKATCEDAKYVSKEPVLIVQTIKPKLNHKPK